jgi:outer membrane lipoprotein SlyB
MIASRILVAQLALGGALGLPLALGACAPANTNSTYTGADIGRTAQVSYGEILAMRPVQVQAASTGVGTLGGAAIGGVAGSFIGGNSARGNILAAVGGAIVGGVAGTAIENQAGRGNAVEFIIQEDGAPQPISVVQTNEENFQPGERIVLTRGARTRIGHVGA